MIIRTPPKITNKSNLLKYVEVDLWSWLRDLTNGLFAINFQENFQSFIVTDLMIPAQMEVAIPNQFMSYSIGTIPIGRIIVRQQGDALIIDGPTSWTTSHVYLQNTSTINNATISVIFFK